MPTGNNRFSVTGSAENPKTVNIFSKECAKKLKYLKMNRILKFTTTLKTNHILRFKE